MDSRDPSTLSAEERRAMLADLLDNSDDASDATLLSEQRRLWMILQLASTQPWHELVALRITGSLDPAALQLALTDLVQRHEALRTVFHDVNGRPVASQLPSVTLRMPVVDLGDDPDGELAALARREAQIGFDIAVGPLVRATLARRSAEDHVLLISVHHLVADQRSVRLVVDNLFAAYSDLVEGRPATASPAPVSIAEVVAAQQAMLASTDAAKDAEYWRESLAGLVPLELPTDRPRPSLKTIAASSVTVPIEDADHQALADYAQRTGQELANVLLAGYMTALSRYAGQRDLAVGVPVPNRMHEDVVSLVGPLDNRLPVRVTLDDDPSLDILVERVATRRAEVIAHGMLPFERVVEEVAPRRDLRHTPLFQVWFSFDDATDERIVPSAVVQTLRLDTGWTPHDVDLSAVREGDSLVLRADYNTDLFDEDTVLGLIRNTVMLLAHAVTDSARPLASLPLLSAEEHEAVVVGWNHTGDAEPAEPLLHRLVERQAQQSPDAIAVAVGADEVNYRSLLARAHVVAHELIGLGVGPESRVGVIATRSTAAVAGLLGVLTGGGAYVPVDPSYPADRLSYLLHDAGVDVVIGAADDLGKLAMPEGSVTVAVPEIDPAEDPGDPGVNVAADNLAYLIYTSGTTGRPKGVGVEHRQIVRSTAARSACEGPGRPERYLVLAPLSFDASAGGLYWTLSRGGTVVLPGETELYDLRRLGDLIRRRGITHVDGVPSQYSVLLESDTEQRESLRAAVVAGEALPAALISEHYQQSPSVPLFNEYGPTETTVWATVHECTPADADLPHIPIGRPVPGARTYLLDDHYNPVPPGVPGELHIGGGGVARGYANRPGATAERFVPDPFSGSGERMYRTGDRARYRRDGVIEFLGRVDNQIKVRGFRVEPAEIEHVLLRHPLVVETVVRLIEPQKGVQRLVAYVVPPTGRAVSQEALMEYTVGLLPDYMVPASFVTLEQMPLTQNGKLDVTALPEPDAPHADGYVEPQTELEAEIADTLGDVLGLARVSVTASFFDLGGDSLMVARLVARLSREHDVDLPIDEIFRVPTPEGIARTVENSQRDQGLVDSEVLYAQQLSALMADVQLDPEIHPGNLPSGDFTSPKDVMVTGVTGYLGAFLAVELLERTEATVHCLVRADDTEAAEERIEQVLRKFLAWDESYRDRLRPVLGDLGKPLLGLTEKRFDELAGTLDLIYHSGAIVNFTFPYEAMKAANVTGTEELLRLATRQRLSAFHFVSSVDVFMGTGAQRPFTEVDLSDRPIRIPTGYPRTKWVAEKLVTIARDRGIPTTVQRPWMITGHTQTGASHHTDYLYVYLKGFLELGVMPLFNDVINAVPVDYTARAIVYTSLRPENFGKNFNITNPEPTTMSQCYEWLRSFGYDINVVDEEEARSAALSVDQDHVLFPMTPMLRVASMRHAALDPDLQKRVNPADECCVLAQALEGSGIDCPPIDEQWAHSCFAYLVEIGFLPAPRELLASARA